MPLFKIKKKPEPSRPVKPPVIDQEPTSEELERQMWRKLYRELAIIVIAAVAMIGLTAWVVFTDG